MKNYFLCKLVSPRPTFPQDMTSWEAELMNEHVGYWNVFAKQGLVIAFGPVVDPNGVWGMALVEVESADQLRKVLDGDPVIKANAGFRFEMFVMPQIVLRT